MIIIIINANFSSAEVTITAITSPASINEGETLNVLFTATTNLSESISYRILKNGLEVSSTNIYSWIIDYTNSGTYIFTFEASDSQNLESENRTITVVNSPISITFNSPESKAYSNTSINIAVESLQADSCNYELNNTETGLLTKTGTIFSKVVSLSEGSYNLMVNCSNNGESTTKQLLFEIDRTPPEIIDSGPDNSYSNAITGTTATLEIETSETSQCKYGTSDNSYDLLSSSFINTNSMNHYAEITSLAQGEHIYYVRCKDSLGNKMSSSETINFYTNKKPTAEVEVKGDSPLKAGRYDVEVTTSESVDSSPLLQYNFHDDSTKRTVSLTGSGTNWFGYIIIDSATPDSVGTFYFSGTDLSGLTGTEITSGKLFLIDTTPPPVISTLEVSQNNAALKLEWYYDFDEIERFKIYRSLDSEISYNDLYATTTSSVFEDVNVDEGVTYYYKLSAEDKAGNVGALSKQISGIVEPSLKEAKALAPSLSAKVDQKINNIESLLLDIDWSVKSLGSETDKDKNEAITKLSLLEKASSIKTSLEGLKKDLEKLKILDLSEEDFNKRISKIDSSVKSQLSGIIRSVVVKDKLEYEQSFDESSFRASLNEFALYKGWNIDEKSIDDNRLVQQKISVNVKLLSVNVDYLYDGSVDKYTIISKTLTTSEPLSDVSIVETIPKSVETDANNILFSETPIVIKKDPMVEWIIPKLSSKNIYYIVFDEIAFSDAKQTKTDVFINQKLVEDLNAAGAEGAVVDDNSITGFASDNTVKNSSWSLIFIIVGFVIIAGLMVYYFFFLNDGEEVVEAPRIVNRRLPVVVDNTTYSFSGISG
ncbi:MAG: hypothetical protein KKF65_06545, partial [Nanoarchaeota archaeon]|nr:hypothetical protein [Nanoarchaeota archaeon]